MKNRVNVYCYCPYLYEDVLIAFATLKLGLKKDSIKDVIKSLLLDSGVSENELNDVRIDIEAFDCELTGTYESMDDFARRVDELLINNEIRIDSIDEDAIKNAIRILRLVFGVEPREIPDVYTK
jgi:SMC interacting uncharacterized protein involved in chromosome segregation